MKGKILLFLIIPSIILGCTNSGRIVDGDGVVYSEYFENITYLEDLNLKIHAIETLGKERLPKEYNLSQDQKSYLRSPDTILTVFEVYITNSSDKSVSIQLGSFRSGGRGGNYEDESLTVGPNSWTKSSPVVGVTTIYKSIKSPYELEFTINGQTKKITGEINRTLVSELGG